MISVRIDKWSKSVKDLIYKEFFLLKPHSVSSLNCNLESSKTVSSVEKFQKKNIADYIVSTIACSTISRHWVELKYFVADTHAYIC